MKNIPKFCIGSLSILMGAFFIVKTSVLLDIEQSTPTTRGIEYFCLIFSILILGRLIREFLNKSKESILNNEYSDVLNNSIIHQSRNEIFYSGKIKASARCITKEITKVLNVERASVWLYNKERTSIICQELYVKSENKFYQNIELLEKDYSQYFLHLLKNPVIVANNAENNPATSCFKETYLKPLGIKSMLDVPIWYKGCVIGVLCIESTYSKKWKSIEINFSQIISSLYSFSYSVNQYNKISKDLLEFDKFVDSSALVSKADSNGKITYVNKKFEDVSGWKLEEAIGKDHKIVNSGKHPKLFWKEMYEKVIKEKGIWNSVITNKNKDGELYWVDSYIKGSFDEEGKLLGFTSIRYDVSNIVRSAKEIEKKNTYLEHASKIIRHDMHSGINTYIPRGISSLERRITQDDIKNLKIEAPLKMIKEGLIHTQKVYKGVYEFTNLVKKDSVLNKEKLDIKKSLENFLSSTSYKSQVIIKPMEEIEVNESLFCTAIDNLIRNGLKYNDSQTKFVEIYMEKNREKLQLSKKYIIVQDNGRGMTQEEFERLSKPYARKEGQKETGTGLGLNICIAILEEHGFKVECEKNKIGTKIKIRIV